MQRNCHVHKRVTTPNLSQIHHHRSRRRCRSTRETLSTSCLGLKPEGKHHKDTRTENGERRTAETRKANANLPTSSNDESYVFVPRKQREETSRHFQAGGEGRNWGDSKERLASTLRKAFSPCSSISWARDSSCSARSRMSPAWRSSSYMVGECERERV